MAKKVADGQIEEEDLTVEVVYYCSFVYCLDRALCVAAVDYGCEKR